MNGYTLIELMIAIAIIGILSAVSIPQLADMLRKSSEAATKGNLGVMRSAIAVYYADTEGTLPRDNLACLVGRYYNTTYNTYVRPWHSPGNVIGNGNQAAFTLSNADTTNWWYFSDDTEAQFGRLIVNCIHTDARGVTWTSY